MTIMVKTPVCPLSLLPPALDISGSWQVETTAQGMIGRFIDSQGGLRGFVLQGDDVDQRAYFLEQAKRCL
jgi:rubredoxin-NAD+ reductase